MGHVTGTKHYGHSLNSVWLPSTEQTMQGKIIIIPYICYTSQLLLLLKLCTEINGHELAGTASLYVGCVSKSSEMLSKTKNAV